MVEFMKEYPDCGYAQKHINKCAKILKKYEKGLLALKNKADDSKIMKYVENVVNALNELNNKTEGCLIETDQREDLFVFIQEKAINAGLTNMDEDITEEWREW